MKFYGTAKWPNKSIILFLLMRPRIVPKKNQRTIIFRFLDKSSTIREEFLSFLLCWYSLNDQPLLKTIKVFLDSNGIDISDCRDQGFNGPRAFAGENQVVAVHALGINSKALYTHCPCHRLTLALVASCGEQCIWNLVTNIKEMSYFFNFSMPRNNCLKEKILQFCPDSSKLKLKDVGRTCMFIILCLEWKKMMT